MDIFDKIVEEYEKKWRPIINSWKIDLGEFLPPPEEREYSIPGSPIYKKDIIEVLEFERDFATDTRVREVLQHLIDLHSKL